ncbi:MAG: DegV family protein [Oscillospiraceae bacterium]|nr:DegV family protein [Oscillospiraceae bacterium]
MSKVKIVTDSASDISREDEERYGIHVMCFPITIGDKSFRDRDITPYEYYELLDTNSCMPVHSQITIFEFQDMYKRFAREGYTDLIYVSINSYGSATYSNAVRAKEMFMSECPELARNMEIRIIDSLTYSGTYGYPVIEAAKSAMEGASPDEIEKKIRSRLERAQVYLACYTLKYCKKSGRISAAAAFAGELLGFRPIILLSGKGIKTIRKVRGDANVVPQLAEVCLENIRPGSKYGIIEGRDHSKAEELAALLTKKLGHPPVPHQFVIGGAVASNAGPDVVAFCIYDSKHEADK